MSPSYSPHWVLSASDRGASIATRPDWFRTFTSCDTFCQGFDGPRSAVRGIGEVVLKVRKTITNQRSLRSSRRTTTIVLKNVLYCPRAKLNVVGHQIYEDYKVSEPVKNSTGPLQLLHRKTDHPAGVLDDFGAGSTRLLLSGQNKGDARQYGNWSHDFASEIFATWPAAERERWGVPSSPSKELMIFGATEQRATERRATEQHATARRETEQHATEQATERWSSSSSSPVSPHPLSLENNEKKEKLIEYKKHQVEEEEEVLVSADGEKTSLSDEILGEVGQQEDEVEPAGPESTESGKGMEVNHFMRELEEDLAHAADRFFASNQLAWIQGRFRHSGDFLMAHDLRPYNEDHCRQGVIVVRALMAYHSRRGRM